jgi:serine beta-lactamase-like protein LACTB
MSHRGSKVRRVYLLALLAAVLLVVFFVVKGIRAGYVLPETESVSSTPYRTIAKYAGAIKEARGVFVPLAGKYPAVSISVGVGRDVVWSEGIGYADLREESPVTSGTRFRIYSLSKPITAAAAAALVERRGFDLDASVREYLPSLPEHYAPVTARHLIGHLAGVRHYEGGEWMKVSESGCASPSDALDIFIDDPLVSSPGESYEYSSYGYVLLSALLEAVSGMDFEKCVGGLVFRPAWMHNTKIEKPDAGETRATFYEPARFGRVKEARPLDNTCRWGAGAFLSTPDDLAQFCLALLDGRIVGGGAFDEIFTSMKDPSGEETGYAFGWGVGVDEAGRPYASHSGGAIGGRAAVYILREQKIVVVILANMEGDPLTDEAAQIAGIFARLSD